MRRGTIRRRLGGPHESESTQEDFRHAVALAPESRLAHAALAGVLMDLGFLQEAMYHYPEVLRLRPADPARCSECASIHRCCPLADAKVCWTKSSLLTGASRGLGGTRPIGLAARAAGEAESLAQAIRPAPWHRERVSDLSCRAEGTRPKRRELRNARPPR